MVSIALATNTLWWIVSTYVTTTEADAKKYFWFSLIMAIISSLGVLDYAYQYVSK